MYYVKSTMLLLGLSLLVLRANGKTADFIIPCRVNDNSCIIDSAKKALKFFKEGIPSIGVPSINSIKMKNVKGDRGSMKLSFPEITLDGMGDCNILNMRRSDTHKVYLEAECPINVYGKYTIKGLVLDLINAEGNGDFEISTDKLWFAVDLLFKSNTGTDEKEYYKVEKFDYKYKPVADVNMKFENLFNGDKTQADPVEKFLEQNGKDLIVTLGEDIVKEMAKKLVEICNIFFAAVPVNELQLS